MTEIDCAIVGAGIHGLCAAFWLSRRGKRVVVLDRHGPGHALGGSHGATRITRSSYHEADLVRLATEAHQDAWPTLERELGTALRAATPGLFFGPPDGPFGDYLRATLAAGVAVEAIPPTTARRLFPLLRIEDDDAVLLDHTAAMILAGKTMERLRSWLHAHGATFGWNMPARNLVADVDSVRIETSSGTVRARSAVVSAGAWSHELEPSMPVTTVLRQEVGYFDLDAPTARTRVGAFPVWARIARANDFVYGLPDHADAGTKAARHVTVGEGTDPDDEPPAIDRLALLDLAREHFAVPVRGLRAAEHCLYAMTPGQSFRVARSPLSSRIVQVTACSGHSFKFGPVIGRAAADLAMDLAVG
ncbi:MAG: FAD-dependent oxidoreductase [Planctomycetes bacterium]|nr:FAD-dependent oxidoreductase [Planctomycetota bacterium]